MMDWENVTSIVFDYLEWCKKKRLTFEETKEREHAYEFGYEMHRKGIEVNGLQLALMMGDYSIFKGSQ